MIRRGEIERSILMNSSKLFPVLALFFIISFAGGDVKDMAQSIPKKILDWEATGQDAVYDRKTIYDYMDGGAEVYLAFDFRNVFVRKYKGQARDEIALDIYDMGSPVEAFGIFSCDRQDPEAGIGQESEYGYGLLRFRQGRFFVSITASGDEQRAEKAILELGKAVAPLLGPPGPIPDLLKCLPEHGLKKDRISYFHAAVNLNNRFFVASENILGLGRETDCVFAEYAASPAETGDLLVVLYPDEDRAQAAYESFLKAYLPMAGLGGVALTENRTWTMAQIHWNYLAVVFEAPSKEYLEVLHSAIKFPKK
jgi:hypothetical protein